MTIGWFCIAGNGVESAFMESGDAGIFGSNSLMIRLKGVSVLSSSRTGCLMSVTSFWSDFARFPELAVVTGFGFVQF